MEQGGGAGRYGVGGDRLEYRERTKRSVKVPSPPPVAFAVSVGGGAPPLHLAPGIMVELSVLG